MFVLFLLLLNVVILFFTFSSFSDKKRIFVPLAEAVSVFLCLFSLVSALMWVFEMFSVEVCLLAVTLIDIAIFTFRYFKSEKKGIEFFSFGEIKVDYRILINKGVIVIATLLSLGAYATIGIGYKDGNERTQALSILNGQNALQFEIKEYQNIEPGSEYEFYFYDSVSNMDRENFTADYSIKYFESEEGKNFKMIGEYGSSPVYPSILALSGTIFGTGRMAFIQAVFAFCIFVFVDEILRVLKCDWKLRSVLILLLGVSPIFVYTNHTTLIEPVIGFCMMMFMYFLLCRKDKLQIISALGVITFAFLHTSVYTMLPLFLVLYWMNYIHKGKIRHLLSSGLMILGYVLSFLFHNITAYKNTAINYRLGLPFLGNYYFVFVIAMAVATVLIGVILAILSPKMKSVKFAGFMNDKGKKLFRILMAVAVAAVIPALAVIIIRKCYSAQDFLHITFIAFVVCSGLIILPVVMFRLISTKYPLGIKEASVIVAFVYTVIIYSCVMRNMLEGYYYGARYISSFIPFVIIIAGMMLRLQKSEAKYVVPIISIFILLVPYTALLLNSKAENRFDSEAFEEVLEVAKERSDRNTIIFVEKNLMQYFYYPLISSTKAKIYPIEPGYFDTFAKDTNEYNSQAIYITNNNGDQYAESGSVDLLKYYYRNEFSENSLSSIIGLPDRYEKSLGKKIQVFEVDAVYKLLNPDLYEEMDFSDIDLTVERIIIDHQNVAHIRVSVTDGSKIYLNNKYLLSYHLEYENAEDLYDFPRITAGPLICESYDIDIDLSTQPEDVTVVIDMVEEGVQWYSWENKVPVILFTENEDGWDYKVYNFYTKL